MTEYSIVRAKRVHCHKLVKCCGTNKEVSSLQLNSYKKPLSCIQTYLGNIT